MDQRAIITEYNSMNGRQIKVATLKSLRDKISVLIVDEPAPSVHLVGILKRISKVVDNSKPNQVLDISLTPIVVPKFPKTNRENKRPEARSEREVSNKVSAGNFKCSNEISLSKIFVDTKRFQNRQDSFSEVSAQSVAENFDPNKFDPIVVWNDPKKKKLFVLAGHSRREGMIRRKAKTIPVRYFKGSEQEAIKFAKVESNRAANQESLIEDLAAYKLMRDGDTTRKISKASKVELGRIFKGKAQKLEAYSYLNKSGLLVQALGQGTTSNYPYIERNGQWIGQLRKDNEVISNPGEDNLFHFFYADKSGRNLKLSKDDFFKLAKKKLSQLGKGESVLFPECNAEGCKNIIDRESDPLKGDAYKRLREISETLESIREKLTSKNANIRVSTEDEKKYLRDTGAKLQDEKEKIQRDLEVIDKSQASLFGLKGKQISISDKGSAAKKKKGKLNKLQTAQLQDSIKAGSTVKVNSNKAKGTKKGWSDTPLFKQELESRQASLFGGFATADKTPEAPKDLFVLPGVMGTVLGKMQRYKLEIVVAGETHSAKSELGKQLADAFIELGDDVAYIDWEQGGLESRDTQESIARNIKPANRKKLHVSYKLPRTIAAVKSLAGKFPVVILDSGTKLNEVTNAWIDQLREDHPETIWIPLMQQNEKGGTRGGSSAEFDAPVVIKTYRPDKSDYKKNYATVEKNRGNPQTTGKHYLIASKQLIESV